MLSALLLLAACSDDSGEVNEVGGGTADREAVLANLATTVIAPAYQHLDESADALVAATTALCAAPDAAHLAAAQEAWDTTRAAWRSTEAFRLGPATTFRSAAAISFPVDLAKVEAVLADPAQLPDPVTTDGVAALGADTRGLPAVEQVLFSPGAPGDLAGRRCAFALGASELVAAATERLRVTWIDGTDGAAPFVEQLSSPGGDSMFADTTEALADLVNGTIAALSQAADMRLGRVTDDVTGTAAPEEVDAGAAHRARADTLDILGSVQAVHDGLPVGTPPPAAGAEASTSGLGALIGAMAPDTETLLARQLGDAAAAVEALPDPFFDYGEPDMAPTSAAYELVRAARVTMRTEVASALGVTLSFSDSDGDS